MPQGGPASDAGGTEVTGERFRRLGHTAQVRFQFLPFGYGLAFKGVCVESRHFYKSIIGAGAFEPLGPGEPVACE
jgi:hypothetical protein